MLRRDKLNINILSILIKYIILPENLPVCSDGSVNNNEVTLSILNGNYLVKHITFST